MAYTAVRSKAVVLLLLIHCLLLIPLCESVIVLCFVVRNFMSILVYNHLDGEERAGCFAWFVLLMSRDCCVALPRGAMSLSAVCEIVVFPDHTHLLFPIITTYNFKVVHFINTLARKGKRSNCLHAVILCCTESRRQINHTMPVSNVTRA